MEYDARLINSIIDDYLFLQQTLEDKKDGFCTSEFKKRFNKLYTVRQKTKTWLKCFYDLFHNCYYRKYSFEECMVKLYEETGQIHPSLCSRIITTLDPTKPSWDSNVLRCMGIVLKEPKKLKKEIKTDYDKRIMNYYSRIYLQIEKEYKKHLEDNNIKSSLTIFDFNVPKAASLPDMKKIDLMIWSLKDKKINSILDYYDAIDNSKK